MGRQRRHPQGLLVVGSISCVGGGAQGCSKPSAFLGGALWLSCVGMCVYMYMYVYIYMYICVCVAMYMCTYTCAVCV